MRITFIRPNMFADRSRDALEPVVFAILRGLTPPEIQCTLVDERLEEVPLDLDTDLVAITAETFTARRAYQIAAHYERRGIPVVLGGYHPSFCPEEALQFASSVVVGDAEGVWPRVVSDARRGRMERIYFGGYPDLAGLHVDRRIFRGKRYRPVALVQFGRGCRYACDFCSIHAFYGRNLRWRPVAEVIGELRTVRRNFVFFTDDNLFNDAERLSELLRAMIPLRLRWSCQASIDVAADERLVRLMADSGCISVTLGLETLDTDNLRLMRKGWHSKYGSYQRLIDRFRRHGIMVYAGFVLGYDHDTPAAFETTLNFAIGNRLFLANFNPLAPTPGSRLYERLRREGRLIDDPWWMHADYRYGNGLFHPQNMTARELMIGCYRARTAFNTYRSMLWRSLDWRANSRSLYHAAAFWLANLTSRREIHRKQGRALGDERMGLTPVYPRSDAEAVGVQQALRYSGEAGLVSV
jgi:radical SAM superfamily enzyme YgiQ (UPF0313 family)